MIAALQIEDYVVIFDEDTQGELTRMVASHVLVKGAIIKSMRLSDADYSLC